MGWASWNGKHGVNDIGKFKARLKALTLEQNSLFARKNEPLPQGNGIFKRWRDPVVTPDHVPVNWRYDLDQARNPYLMERFGINSTFNSGAIYFQGRYVLVVRTEGNDRKSWFACASSDNGVDGFRFWERPIDMPQASVPETNVYDIRLTEHEDSYIYGLFCTERKDPARPDEPAAAIAACGIARTRDLVHWERLPDLQTRAEQQRNVVLHPEFVDGRYAFYTRPQDSFIDVGNAGGGICWGLSDSIENARIEQEILIDPRMYHTVAEAKNGQGPPPLKTPAGWLHLAHGVRQTAAGLRYVLYLFLTDLEHPWKIVHKPAGYLLAPRGVERTGDVSNVVFSGGWIRDDEDRVFIYYASSDTRIHVATTTTGRLLDYCLNTPEDGLHSAASVRTVNRLIDQNEKLT